MHKIKIVLKRIQNWINKEYKLGSNKYVNIKVIKSNTFNDNSTIL